MGNVQRSVTRAWSLLLVISLLFLTSCSSRPVASDMPPPDPLAGVVADTDYLISAGDLLTVQVFQIEELERQVRVDNSGRITLPLIGTIKAAGLSEDQLQKQITELYSKTYLQDPQVTVLVDEFTGRRVTVSGAVTKPGLYPVVGSKLTLQQAIAQAEGVSQLASRRNVVVFRQIDGEKKIARFDLPAIEKGEMPDPEIYGGDIVVVYRSDARLLLRTVLELTPFVMVWRAYR
ncbi:polysaccharide biosynthesis/export family protein [Pseudoxanthomonas composti]|uniref:Polysaccharide export protein n=1 Tax=Pseudoxanthomonas composti TaxID=2137479 RepID=A0A4Q1JZA4_9GAMM|nr:polysaccharide export protein [Pseudoxanthomonas composti]